MIATRAWRPLVTNRLWPLSTKCVAVGHGGRPIAPASEPARRLRKRVTAELLLLGQQREVGLFLRVVAVARDGIADERIVDGDDGAERRPLFRDLDEAGHIGDEIVLAPEQSELRDARDDRPPDMRPLRSSVDATGAICDAANSRARRWTSCWCSFRAKSISQA